MQRKERRSGKAVESLVKMAAALENCALVDQPSNYFSPPKGEQMMYLQKETLETCSKDSIYVT
jgi:hypothetical protein